MVKIVLMILYLLIGFYLVGKVLGKYKDMIEEDPVKQGVAITALIIVCVLELLLWPIMIVVSVGINSGKNEDD